MRDSNRLPVVHLARPDHERVLSPRSDGVIGRRFLLLSTVVALAAIAGGALTLVGGAAATGATGVWSVPSILALISIAATVTYLSVFVALHVLPTGFNPVRHAVSDYAIGRYGPLFRFGLYASSVGALTLAFALIEGVGSPPLPARDLLYLLLIPLTRLGMAMFPTTVEGRRLTRTGLLHYVFAIAAFTLTYLAISGITPFFLDLAGEPWSERPLRWTAWAVAPELVLVVVTMVPALRRVFGVFERLFLVTTNIWFLLAAGFVLDRIS